MTLAPSAASITARTPSARSSGEAAAVAAQRAMRGSDAVYAATAFRYGASLVTLDLEQRDRVAAVVDCYTPEEILTGGFEGGS